MYIQRVQFTERRQACGAHKDADHIYIYIYTHIYIYTYIYTYICMYVDMYM